MNLTRGRQVAWCLAAFWFLAWPSASLGVSGVDLRECLVRNAEQIKSFAGRYRFLQETHNGYQIDAFHEYRVQGDNLYIAHDEKLDPKNKSDNARRRRTISRLNGVISSFDSRPPVDAADPPILQGQIGWGSIPMTESAYMSPLDITRGQDKAPLSEQLAAGEVAVIDTPQGPILRHTDWARSQRTDYHFDSALRLTLIEQGVVPTRAIAESCVSAGATAEDLFQPRWRIECGAYTVIGGVEFPAEMSKTFYSYKQEESLVRSMKEQQEKAGDDMSVIVPLAMGYFRETKSTQFVFAKQTIELLPGEVRINEPLADDEFRIKYPEGTRLFDLFQQGVSIVGEVEKDILADVEPTIAPPPAGPASGPAVPAGPTPTAGPQQQPVSRPSHSFRLLAAVAMAALVLAACILIVSNARKNRKVQP